MAETEVPRENQTSCKSLTNFITSPWVGFELTMLVVIGTDCIDSCKSNYDHDHNHPLECSIPL